MCARLTGDKGSLKPPSPPGPAAVPPGSTGKLRDVPPRSDVQPDAEHRKPVVNCTENPPKPHTCTHPISLQTGRHQ